ncbi:MAG: phosphatase PAP2-related protein [bacterium]
MINNLFQRHKNTWNKEVLFSLGVGLIMFFIALVVQKAADIYVLSIKGTPVSDIILNNIPTFDIDSFIILSVLGLTFLAVVLFLAKPKYINFGIKSVALFIIVRAFFISLTHLGVNPHEVIFSPNSFGYSLYNFLYNSHNDFFFSGHTGIPFLLALIFWPEKKWRKIFFVISFIFGASVLLGHIHYSIDVFAAPFITYSIFELARITFPKDYENSHKTEPVKNN